MLTLVVSLWSILTSNHITSLNCLLSLLLAIRCAVSVTSGQCTTEELVILRQVDCSPSNVCTIDSDCTGGECCNFLQPVSQCSDETFPATGGTCGRRTSNDICTTTAIPTEFPTTYMPSVSYTDCVAFFDFCVTYILHIFPA